MEKTGASTKRLQAAREMPLVASFYRQALEAPAAGRPVGRLPPMNGAIEIFYAMDLQPVLPENWSPLCAAFGYAPQNFQAGEEMGYSQDLCGYLRNIVGYVYGLMEEEGMPLRLPEPDLLLSFGGGCVPAMKIFQILEEKFPRTRVFRADLPQVPPAAWSLRLDPARPLKSLAYKSLVSYPLVSCVSLRRRKEMVLEACRNCHIDGVILHSNKSCKPITPGQMLIKEALKRELGLPAVVIDTDHMDARLSIYQGDGSLDIF